MAGLAGALLVSKSPILPLHLWPVTGASAGRIGLVILPLTGAVGLETLMTGRLVSRTGLVAIFPAVGQTVAILRLMGFALRAASADAAVDP